MPVEHRTPLKSEQPVDADPAGVALESAATHNSLFEMQAEFAFFTTALIVCFGPLDRDPVTEYIQFHGTDQAGGPFAINSEVAFFSGLPTAYMGTPPHGELVNWNHRLYAVHKSRADDCLKFMAGITVIDKNRPCFTNVGFYDLEIVDPTHCGAGGLVTEYKKIPLTVFGVDSSRGRYYISPALHEPIDKPYLMTEGPTDEAIAMLARMRAHDFAPVGVFADQVLELPKHEHGSQPSHPAAESRSE
jgi:hypothetical protein